MIPSDVEAEAVTRGADVTGLPVTARFRVAGVPPIVPADHSGTALRDIVVGAGFTLRVDAMDCGQAAQVLNRP